MGPCDAIADLVTCAPQMAEVFERIRRGASTDTTVLIRGETGTGKELVARAIHAMSRRSDAPFRAINCATLTGDLLASELFGHVRGAFTGAVSNRPGLLSQCDGGTLFLDEIAELPLDIQPRLLRVLQEQQYVPVGGNAPIKVDVRLVSATHRALRRLVSEGHFRADLMYRVRVATLFLPPLRERDGDIAHLTHHFIRGFNADGGRQVTSVSPGAMHALTSYPWPGNVRELRNAIEGCFAFGVGPTLMVDELPPELRGEGPPSEHPSATGHCARRHILHALDQAGGRKADAAKLLGISRSTLWRKMRELDIQA